jgi:hypothetical protein
MIGFTNLCPKCGKISHFVPEEMECDKSLVSWCKHCGDYISQTFTLETFRKWWERYDAGEDDLKPPISKAYILVLQGIEKMLEDDPDCYLDKVEIHFKDFTDYKYTEVEEDDISNNS